MCHANIVCTMINNSLYAIMFNLTMKATTHNHIRHFSVIILPPLEHSM